MGFILISFLCLHLGTFVAEPSSWRDWTSLECLSAVWQSANQSSTSWFRRTYLRLVGDVSSSPDGRDLILIPRSICNQPSEWIGSCWSTLSIWIRWLCRTGDESKHKSWIHTLVLSLSYPVSTGDSFIAASSSVQVDFMLNNLRKPTDSTSKDFYFLVYFWLFTSTSLDSCFNWNIN